MTEQEYQLNKLQLARLKANLHKRFIYRDAITFTKTLLKVEQYEQNKRIREAEGFSKRDTRSL